MTLKRNEWHPNLTHLSSFDGMLNKCKNAENNRRMRGACCVRWFTSSPSLSVCSDPVLYGGAHLPHRLLYQRGGRPAVQAAQQHGGGLLVCALRPLHLLHHSGTAVCRKSLPPGLRTPPRSPLDCSQGALRIPWDLLEHSDWKFKNKTQQNSRRNPKTGRPPLMCQGTAAPRRTERLKDAKRTNEPSATGQRPDGGGVRCERVQPPRHCWFQPQPYFCCRSVGEGCLMCCCHGNHRHCVGAHFLRTTTATHRFDSLLPPSQHTSAPSRPLLLLFLAPPCYFQTNLLYFFFFLFSSILHHLASEKCYCCWLSGNWRAFREPVGVGGEARRPAILHGLRCAVGKNSCVCSCSAHRRPALDER